MAAVALVGPTVHVASFPQATASVREITTVIEPVTTRIGAASQEPRRGLAVVVVRLVSHTKWRLVLPESVVLPAERTNEWVVVVVVVVAVMAQHENAAAMSLATTMVSAAAVAAAEAAVGYLPLGGSSFSVDAAREIPEQNKIAAVAAAVSVSVVELLAMDMEYVPYVESDGFWSSCHHLARGESLGRILLLLLWRAKVVVEVEVVVLFVAMGRLVSYPLLDGCHCLERSKMDLARPVGRVVPRVVVTASAAAATVVVVEEEEVEESENEAVWGVRLQMGSADVPQLLFVLVQWWKKSMAVVVVVAAAPFCLSREVVVAVAEVEKEVVVVVLVQNVMVVPGEAGVQ